MQNLSRDTLMRVLSYNSETGAFKWLETGYGRRKIVGCIQRDGCRSIEINGKAFKAHRLAWLFVYGDWPPNEIDHINGNPDDNRIVNLRIATHEQNCRNRKCRGDSATGVKGVYRLGNRWRARINTGTKFTHLGVFDTVAEAAAAYDAAAKSLHGEFARLNER